MAIRGGKIASVADDGNPAKIQPSEINPFTEPLVPVQNDIWIDITGTSPNLSMAIKIYRDGAWRTLASVTDL